MHGPGLNGSQTKGPELMKLSVLNSLPPRCKKLAVWTAAVVLLYTVLGFLLLPLIERMLAVNQLSKLLDRPVTIQNVRINPFTFSATIRGLLIQDKDGATLVSWDEACVNFQLASLFTHAWVFKEISLSHPFVRVQINKDYKLNFSDIVARLSPPSPPKSSDPGPRHPWRINRLRLTGAKASFTDLTPRMSFQRTIGPLEMTLLDFKTDPGNKNRYAFTGITDGGERFSWKGFFYLEPLRSEGEFSLDGISLIKYAPLYQDWVRFEIKDGVLHLHSTYRYERSAATNLLMVTNTTFALESLKVVEKETGQTVVEAANFVVTGASVDALARQAEAESVTVTGGRFLLRRNQDTSLNAIELAKPAEAAPNTPGGILLLLRAMTNVMAMLLNSTNLSNGGIRELNLTHCALHLEDLANPQPVRLDLEGITVHANNISNRAGTNMSAEVSLRWDTNGTARADVRARFSPPSAEVKLVFDDLNLLPLSPYSGRYLGYRLLKGKLSAQLSYQITERKLKSENRLTLNQLILGQKTESPDATRLPVRLAIALLKDRDGRIALELPVNGSLDDPQFDLGRLAYREIETALTRIVTSPFSALGALFRGKGEELSFQDFQPGSTNLLPAAIAKLDLLAQGLYARPELQLELEGNVDPLTDLQALRREKLNQQSPAQEWNVAGNLSPAAANAAATEDPPARLSRKAFSFEKGTSALGPPMAYWSLFETKSNTKSSLLPRNSGRAFADDKGATALMLILAPAEFPGEWDAQPLETVEIAPDALRTLAVERAQTVKAYLLQTGKVEAQRITESSRGDSSKGSRVYARLQ